VDVSDVPDVTDVPDLAVVARDTALRVVAAVVALRRLRPGGQRGRRGGRLPRRHGDLRGSGVQGVGLRGRPGGGDGRHREDGDDRERGHKAVAQCASDHGLSLRDDLRITGCDPVSTERFRRSSQRCRPTRSWDELGRHPGVQSCRRASSHSVPGRCTSQAVGARSFTPSGVWPFTPCGVWSFAPSGVWPFTPSSVWSFAPSGARLSLRPAFDLSARPAFEDEAVQADRGPGRSPETGCRGGAPQRGPGRSPARGAGAEPLVGSKGRQPLGMGRVGAAGARDPVPAAPRDTRPAQDPEPEWT